MASYRNALIPKDACARLPTMASEASSLSQKDITFQDGQLLVKNDAHVEAGLIHRILSPIPRLPFRLAILLSSGYWPHRLVGIEPGSGTLPRPCLVLQKDPAWLASRLPGKWDIAINIAERTCELARTFPVYFALTLLQEIAHARIANRDLALHMVHCMLFDLMWNDALAEGRRLLEYDLPGERQCIRAALKQGRRIFGTRTVDQELARMSREARPFLGSGGEVREYADWVSVVDPEGKDVNLYEETRLVASKFAHRLMFEWRIGRKEIRRMLRLKDLKRIIG